jgi:hypothetical protein
MVPRLRSLRSDTYAPCLGDRMPLGHGALFGEHSVEVLTTVAGLTTEEVDKLIASGVVATEPPA